VTSISPDHPVPRQWRLSPRAVLQLDRPIVMGILNVTPDSFSDGGRLATPQALAAAAHAMIQSGADILDLGAESTRPGAPRISETEQLARILPAVAALRAVSPDIPITIDTTLEPVARAALDAGADAINDVSAGTDSDDAMLHLAAERRCGLVLMHRLKPPPADSYSDAYAAAPHYGDVVRDVSEFLAARAQAALAAGVPRECIVLDPGLGFGKSVQHNLDLIAGTPTLAALGFPILSGLSRKSFVGRVSLGRDSTPLERLPGTLALSVTHLAAGASIFRVHDIPEHRAALDAAFLAHSRVFPPRPTL
jgi:dihydropteroate synthase